MSEFELQNKYLREELSNLRHIKKKHDARFKSMVILKKQRDDLRDAITFIYDRLDGSWYAPNLQSEIRERYQELVGISDEEKSVEPCEKCNWIKNNSHNNIICSICGIEVPF